MQKQRHISNRDPFSDHLSICRPASVGWTEAHFLVLFPCFPSTHPPPPVWLSEFSVNTQEPANMKTMCWDKAGTPHPHLLLIESVFKIDYFWRSGQPINNNADYNKPEDDHATQYLSPMSTSRGIRNQWPTQSINTLRLKVTAQWGEAVAPTGGKALQLKEPINFQPLRAINTSIPTGSLGRGGSPGFSKGAALIGPL